MALDYNNLSALTRDKFIPVLVDNIFDSNVLCHRMLRKSKAAASGNKVLQPLEYGKADAKGFYSGYDVLDTSPTEVFTDAAYNWKQAYASISISGKEESLNDGAERVIDLIEAKVKNAEKSIKDMFGTALYADQDDSGDDIIGLRHICKVDRDLGGIDSTTYTWWDAQVAAFGSDVFATVAASSGADSIGRELRKMYGSCTVGSDHPSLIVTTQHIFDCYEESLSGQKRFGAADTSLADAGFQALKYRGASVVVDDHCPAGMAFFLNEKYLAFRHHRKRNFKFQGFQKPVNQDAAVAKIIWLGALTCSNARMQGVLTGGPVSY